MAIDYFISTGLYQFCLIIKVINFTDYLDPWIEYLCSQNNKNIRGIIKGSIKKPRFIYVGLIKYSFTAGIPFNNKKIPVHEMLYSLRVVLNDNKLLFSAFKLIDQRLSDLAPSTYNNMTCYFTFFSRQFYHLF